MQPPSQWPKSSWFEVSKAHRRNIFILKRGKKLVQQLLEKCTKKLKDQGEAKLVTKNELERTK